MGGEINRFKNNFKECFFVVLDVLGFFNLVFGFKFVLEIRFYLLG